MIPKQAAQSSWGRGTNVFPLPLLRTFNNEFSRKSSLSLTLLYRPEATCKFNIKMHFKQLLHRQPSDEFLSGEERCQVITTQRGQISSVPTTSKLLQKGIKVSNIFAEFISHTMSHVKHLFYTQITLNEENI